MISAKMEQLVSSLYDWCAPRYDKFFSGYAEHCWNELMAVLPETQGRWVLDAGCGTGLITERVADGVGNWGQVVGVDLSEKMIEAARKRFIDRRNIVLQKGSVSQVQSRDRSFDLVVCCNVISHLSDLAPVLREWRRLLKQDGEVALLDWDQRSFKVRLANRLVQLKIPSQHARSSDEVILALQNHGFVISQTKNVNISPFWPVWIIVAKKN